jgi:formylglycine-generating enzyme required for sulfatase activity
VHTLPWKIVSLVVVAGCGARSTLFEPEDLSPTDARPADASSPPVDSAAPDTGPTIGRFRRFVAAWRNGYMAPPGSGKHVYLNGGLGLVSTTNPGIFETGWLASDAPNVEPTDANLACDPAPTFTTWTPAVGPQENLPVDCVNWYEAYAFCIWDGGFLPSKTEWEYAAAGGGGPDGQREYPWGSTDPGYKSLYAIYNDVYYVYLQPNQLGLPYMAPVGTTYLGAGAFGQFDLVGEVYEWNLDTFGSYTSSCTDCVALTPNAYDYRVERGGDFFTTASPSLLPPTQHGDTSTAREVTAGVRCARSP